MPLTIFNDIDLNDAANKEYQLVHSLSYYPIQGTPGTTFQGVKKLVKHIKGEEYSSAGNCSLAEKDKSIDTTVSILSILIKSDNNIIIAAVPSSKKNNKDHGITTIASKLAENTRNIDGTCRNTDRSEGILIRNEDIQQAHQGGERTEEARKKGLKAAEDISGKTVLLLDDVYTTGTSIAVAKKALEEKGAQVFCLTIGKANTTTNINTPTEFEKILRRKIHDSLIDDPYSLKQALVEQQTFMLESSDKTSEPLAKRYKRR